MAMPSNPVLVTASEVPESAVVAYCAPEANSPYKVLIAAILNDPAIQTLIVRKVVEAMSETQILTMADEIDANRDVDAYRAAMLAALLPTRGTDHG